MGKKKENSSRTLRAAVVIKKALIEVLRNGKSLDASLIDSLISVSKVIVSPDLRYATCYITSFPGSKVSKEDLIKSLDLSKKPIRALITQKIQMRYSPELRFIYDNGFEQAVIIEEILSKRS